MKLSVAVLAAITAAAQTAPGPAIRSTTSEVLLDLVVRDKHGKPVKNLKAGDVEIYEDGARQELKSFHFVGARESQKQKQTAAATGATTGQTLSRPLRAVNLVCIVFHNLDPVSRRRTIEALQEWSKSDLPPETYVALFHLADRLTPIIPFTNNRAEIAQAINNAFSLKPLELSAAIQPVLTANPTQFTVTAVVDNATHAVTINGQATGGELARTLVTGADVSTGSGASLQRGAQVIENRDFSNISGMRESDKINTMISELGALPGRKTVLLVSTGLVTEGEPERFEAMTSKANRLGLTVYSFDVGGLRENSTSQEGNVQLGQVASVSRNQTAAVGVGDNLSAAKEKSRQGDSVNDAVRSSDAQASLRALAEATGGYLIANTTDYKKSFQRMVDDLDSHYEAIYRPASDKYDGHLRKIEVKLARAELSVESRTGYFAMPDLRGSSPVLLPFETTALAILGTKPPPHGFDFNTATYRFHNDGNGTQGSLVLEVPGVNLAATQAGDKYRLHASLFAVMKDSSNQIVDKFSLDAPYEVPGANLPVIRSSAAMFTHAVNLAPGRYTVEAVVLDREGSRASSSITPFDVPEARKGVDISSVVLVQRLDPASGPDPSDPLIFQGKRLVPFAASKLPPDAKPFLYFVVYPDKGNPEKPKIKVEFLVDGKVVATQEANLPAPDATGAIPMVVKAATHTGNCEMKITALQGTDSAASSAVFNIAAAK